MRSIGVIALGALVIGISEEITYRGFLIFRLESLGKVAAVLITGVLFIAVHINNLLSRTLKNLPQIGYQ